MHVSVLYAPTPDDGLFSNFSWEHIRLYESHVYLVCIGIRNKKFSGGRGILALSGFFLALLKDCMVVLPLEPAWMEVARVKAVIRA